MYHQIKPKSSLPASKTQSLLGTYRLQRLINAAFISLLALSNFSCADARHQVLTSGAEKEHVLAKGEFPLPPRGKALKKRPTGVAIYERDTTPLGNRSPLLMVHGLNGERMPTFRWQKLQDYLVKNQTFDTRYKIYMARYSTMDRVSHNLGDYKKAFNSLWEGCGKKPVTVMALSVGGNLAYEAMTDKDIDSKMSRLITFGTPFHGSPLFTGDWLSYSLYRRFGWPWTRVEHYQTYKFYFKQNHQLREDFYWDNVDAALPEVGHFHSKLPLGPHGELTVGDATNDRLAAVNSRPVDKRKLVTYGGYMNNAYLATRDKRIIESAFIYPYFALFTSFPAHLGREHAALGLINKDMSGVQTTAVVREKAGSPFIYVLNDGITPLTSSIFMPRETALGHYLARENDLEKLRDKLDVGQARVFKNIDHLSFIGSEPRTKIPAPLHEPLKDYLNPQETPREMFAWILNDVLDDKTDVESRLAKNSDAKTTATEATPQPAE
jgi:hypothetical protein